MINTTKGLVEGQLILHSWIDDDGDFTWDFCVVKAVFDDRFLFVNQNGKKVIYDIVEEVDEKTNKLHNKVNTGKKSVTCLLLQDGNPVMCRKDIFGRYMFEPKNKG